MRIKPKIAVFLAFSLVSLYARAAIPPQEMLDTVSIKPVQMPKGIKPEDVALVIPMNLAPGINDEDVILSKVMDHSINKFLHGDYFKNTEFGKAAARVEEAMKTEVNLGTTEDESGGPAVEHKINVQVAALEQRAYLAYTGITNVNLNVTNLGITASINQTIGEATSLVLSHDTRDAISRVNMIWAW